MDVCSEPEAVGLAVAFGTKTTVEALSYERLAKPGRGDYECEMHIQELVNATCDIDAVRGKKPVGVNVPLGRKPAIFEKAAIRTSIELQRGHF